MALAGFLRGTTNGSTRCALEILRAGSPSPGAPRNKGDCGTIGCTDNVPATATSLAFGAARRGPCARPQALTPSTAGFVHAAFGDVVARPAAIAAADRRLDERQGDQIALCVAPAEAMRVVTHGFDRC